MPHPALPSSDSSLLDDTPVGLYEADATGCYAFVNTSWCELTGISIEQVLDERRREDIHPTDRARVDAAWKALCSGETQHLEQEYRVCRPNGTVRWVLNRAVRRSMAEDGADRYVGALTDIDALKRSELALAEREGRYHGLFSNMSEGFLLGDVIEDARGQARDVRVLEVSQDFERQTGLTGAIPGHPLREALPQAERAWLAEYVEMTHDGRPVQFDVYNQETAHWYEVFGYRPEPERFAALFHDVTAQRHMEAALRDEESHWHQLAEAMPNLVWTWSALGRCDYLSPQWIDYTGRPADEQLGFGWLRQIHTEDRDALAAAWMRALHNGMPFDTECRIRHHDGHWHWFKICAQPARDSGGKIVKWYGSSTDIEALKQVEAALRSERDTREAILQSMTEGLVIAEPSGRIVSLNPAAMRLYGFVSELEAPRDLADYARLFEAQSLAGDSVPPSRWPLARACSGEVFTNHELQLSRRDTGQAFIGSYCGAPVLGPDGAVRFGITTIRDITAQKYAEAQIAHLAYYDALTELPNRRLLEERLTAALRQARRHRSKVAVMILDLDFFKQINDSLGHAMGDALLVQMAQRMQSCVRASDTVARPGGDEFMLVLPEVDADGAARFAEKLVTRLAEPLLIEGHEISVSCSLGISLYPDNGKTDKELLSHADTAMYRAKQQGRNAYQFFTEAMHREAMRIMTLEYQLRMAIARDELVLYYQPQVELGTERLIGLEALIRWNHPERGLLGADAFVPLAESSGLIQDLGEWVLRAVGLQLQSWATAGLQSVPVAVNLSAQQFRHSQRRIALCTQIESLLGETGLVPDRLELEITENSLLEETQDILRTLHMLNEIGVRLALDDFGTGYSSLRYLQSYPVDRLKIDQSFVRRVAVKRKEAAIVDTILSLARHLELEVIAEGVETQAQLIHLRQCGCPQAQGFYFSQPLPPEDVRQWLERVAPEKIFKECPLLSPS